MQGMSFSSLKKHPALIPLYVCVGMGCAGAAFYILRLATRNPDVTWNRKSNPEPWQEYSNKQYKPTHKIQSDSGPPTIYLQLVPKMLKPLVSLWVPDAYVISFKLETDENILIAKAKGALDKYKHRMVIANLLQTRKTKVVIVTQDSVNDLTLTEEDFLTGLEIEKKIVTLVTKKHNEYCVTL